MKNFISKGITLNILVPAGGLLSGAPYAAGGKVVVCVTDLEQKKLNRSLPA